jgi:hypothetical protein
LYQSRVYRELLNNKKDKQYKDLNRCFFDENVQMANKHRKQHSTLLVIG